MKELGVDSATEQAYSTEAIGKLKWAMFILQDRMVWDSSDGMYTYVALPLGPAPDYSTLGNMGMPEFWDRFNTWSVTRLPDADVNNEVNLEEYRIVAGMGMLVTQHVMPDPPEDSNEAQRLEIAKGMAHTFNAELEIQGVLGLNDAILQDYANLDNALYDLNVCRVIATNAYYEAQDGLNS